MAVAKNITGWEHFSHGADIGVRGFGGSLEEAFEQAALGLTAVGGAVFTIGQGETGEGQGEEPAREVLFLRWLNAGSYEKEINMDRYASGVYFYRLRAGTHAQVKKALLLK